MQFQRSFNRRGETAEERDARLERDMQAVPSAADAVPPPSAFERWIVKSANAITWTISLTVVTAFMIALSVSADKAATGPYRLSDLQQDRVCPELSARERDAVAYELERRRCEVARTGARD